METLVNWLFKWSRLREAIFAEVNFYNSLNRLMKDPESKKVASAFWDEGDGWRGWTIEDNKYYFSDIPERDLLACMLELEEMHGQKSL